MTSIQLAEYIVMYVGFCKSFCKQPSEFSCCHCPHETAWKMYILALDMLEMGYYR